MKRRRFELRTSRTQVRRAATFSIILSRVIQIFWEQLVGQPTEYSRASVRDNSEVFRRAYKPGVSKLPAYKWYLGGLEAHEADLKRRFKRSLQETGLLNK